MRYMTVIAGNTDAGYVCLIWMFMLHLTFAKHYDVPVRRCILRIAHTTEVIQYYVIH